MTLSKLAGRKLVRDHEMTLLDFSFPPLLEATSLPRLKQRIARAHRLHEKYRDLAEQQSGEARGKRAPAGGHAANGNGKTVDKQTLFAEVSARLEAELTKRIAETPAGDRMGRVVADTAPPAETPPAEVTPGRGTAGESLDSAAERGVESQLARAKSRASSREAESIHSESARSANLAARQGEVAHLAHGAARGRRVQARRDQPRG